MATNSVRFLKNLGGDLQPLIIKGLFQAGLTQAIKRGELLKLSAGNWVPLDADYAMNGAIAIANEEIKSGDRAGYYEIIVPRPDDVFEAELATATALTLGQKLYYSSSEAVTTTGTNPLGYSTGHEHYPAYQGHLADDASGDQGTTIATTAYARMVIDRAASYYSVLIATQAGLPLGTLYNSTYGAMPFLIQTVCTAAGAEDETVLAAAPIKFRIVNAWMIARDANNVNVTLKNATNAFTGAVAKGAADDALIAFDTIIAEYDEVAAAAAVIASFSGAGSAEICLLCIPIP